LPVAAGGLSVRIASQIVLPAFLSPIIGLKNLCLKTLPSRLHATVDGSSQSSQRKAVNGPVKVANDAEQRKRDK
jgi:hypothetical protein